MWPLFLALLLTVAHAQCGGGGGGGGLSREAITGIGLGLFALVVVLFVVFLIVLKYRNRTMETRPTSHPHKFKRFLAFFFEYVFFELVALPFAVFGVLGLEEPGKWVAPVANVAAIRVAFYVFLALKYALVITIGLVENVKLYHLSPTQQEDEIRRRWLAPKRFIPFLPGTWITLVESSIFIPVVIIDGMIINGEWAIGDTGDIFPYDGYVLLLLDIVLFVKLRLMFTLDIFGPRPYHLPDIVYSCVAIVMQTCLVLLFIINHLRFVCSAGFNVAVNNFLIVTLVLACSHELTANYTSMMLQGMRYRAAALGDNASAIVKHVNVYIRVFSMGILAMLLNLFLFGWQFASYIIIFIITGQLIQEAGVRPEPVLVVGIYFVSVLTLALTVFYFINLCYGFAKRLGSWSRRCGCPCPFYSGIPCLQCFKCYWLPPIRFNCSSYAETLNPILQRFTTTSMRFNQDMQI